MFIFLTKGLSIFHIYHIDNRAVATIEAEEAVASFEILMILFIIVIYYFMWIKFIWLPPLIFMSGYGPGQNFCKGCVHVIVNGDIII